MISEAYSWLLAISTVLAVLVALRLFLPARDLFDAALGVFVERDAELLDQVLAPFLDEPGHVLGEVLGAFGDEIAEARQHLVADRLFGQRGFAMRLG